MIFPSAIVMRNDLMTQQLADVTAKIQYGPKEKVCFQFYVVVYFRFFMKPEIVHHSLFLS